MNNLIAVVIVLLMFIMSVLPLFIVIYLGNERSMVGPFVLAGALVVGALFGTTLIATS